MFKVGCGWDGSAKPLTHLVNNGYITVHTTKGQMSPGSEIHETEAEPQPDAEPNGITINEETVETVDNESYYVLSCEIGGKDTVQLDLKCDHKTVSFKWDKVLIAEGVHGYNPVTNLIKDLPYHEESELTSTPFKSLTLYMEKEHIQKINENNYKEGTNPFAYLATTSDYTIIPSPESCSTLMTTYNIQTSGIVIGANIESHAFSINNLGNSVDVIVNDVAILTKEMAQALEAIKKLQEKTNPFSMENILFAFAKAGAGYLLGAICAGIKGAFQMGERIAMQAVEEEAEMELEDLTLQVGKDFQRVNVKQELQCDSHIVLKSGNVLKTDTIQALADAGITFDAQKLTMFTKALTGFATSDACILKLFGSTLESWIW